LNYILEKHSALAGHFINDSDREDRGKTGT